MNLTYFQPRS